MLSGEIQQQMPCQRHAKQAEFILVICWHSSVNGSVLLTEFSLLTWSGFKPIFVLQKEPHKSNLISLEAARMIKEGCLNWSVWQGTTTSTSRFLAFRIKGTEVKFSIPFLCQCPGTSLYNRLVLTILLTCFSGDELKPRPELRMQNSEVTLLPNSTHKYEYFHQAPTDRSSLQNWILSFFSFFSLHTKYNSLYYI